MPTISFLILTYNSSSYINRLLDSLIKILQDELRREEIEIIIEDNSSSDDTVELVKEYIEKNNQKNIILHESRENKGYARGINSAAKLSHGGILVVINPDSELLEFDVKKITDEFKNNEKLAIGGLKVIDFQGKAEKTAGKFFNPFTFLAFALGFENIFNLRYSPNTKTKVDFVSGGFVAFRKESFEKLNGYDEDYFMYVEDMDVCYRAEKEGQSVYFLPFGTIRHKGQGSSSREFAIVNIYKGLQIFYSKNGSFFSTLYVKNLLTLKAALIIFIGAVLGKKDLVKIYSKALQTIV